MFRHAVRASALFALAAFSPVHVAAEEGKGTGDSKASAPVAEEKKSEWQAKPRWRVQYDWANIDGPRGLPDRGGSEQLRRAQLGVDIKMPGGFSARIEGEFTADPVELVDAFVAWERKNERDSVNVTLGQQKFFTPLDDMTSDLNTSFMERAAFVTAFNYARRTGLSAGYSRGDFQIHGGTATDTLIQLNDVGRNSISTHVRAVWKPSLGDAKLHLGAAYHGKSRRDSADDALRLRQRPHVRTVDSRYIATPALFASREHSWGVEAAGVLGRLHVAGEAHWHKAERNRASDPTFFGAYAEVGVFLTDDSRPLSNGAFGAIKPKKPLDKGGIGAIQLNARYDYLDLNSRDVRGGTQDGYMASLIWSPTSYLRLMAQYARLDYRGAAVAVGGRRDYSADVFGARMQLTY